MCFELFLAAQASGCLGDLAAFPGEMEGTVTPGHGDKDHGGPQIPVTALLVLATPVSVTSGRMWLSVPAAVLSDRWGSQPGIRLG